MVDQVERLDCPIPTDLPAKRLSDWRRRRPRVRRSKAERDSRDDHGVSNERIRGVAVTLADSKAGDELRVGVNRDELPCVATELTMIFCYVAQMTTDVAPNSIHLKTFARQVARHRIEQSLAALPDANAEPDDRIAVDFEYSFRRADARSFGETGDNRDLFSEGKDVCHR